jgi:hypothetical protein
MIEWTFHILFVHELLLVHRIRTPVKGGQARQMRKLFAWLSCLFSKVGLVGSHEVWDMVIPNIRNDFIIFNI